MKMKISYIGIVLLFFSVTALKGQDQQPEPRRTAAEQAAFEKTIPVNPAKITPATQNDSRLDPLQQQAPPTNWKPGNAPVEDRKPQESVTEKPVKVTGIQEPAANRTQPEGGQMPEKPKNHRETIGQRTQPEGQKAANPTEQRKTEGIRTQPEGEKPNK